MGNTIKKHKKQGIDNNDPFPEETSYTAIGRRKSVFAEAYDPEEEDELEEKIVSNYENKIAWTLFDWFWS